MGNATPMPERYELSASAASAGAEPAFQPAKPEPRIGKDPRADEFLRQEAAARGQVRNADRAAAEQHDREQQREEEWREQRRSEMSAIAEPIEAPATAPLPPKAQPPAERTDRPGLVKTTPEYGMVTSKLEPEDLRSAEVIAKWLDAGGLYKQKFKGAAAIVTVIMYGKALGLPMMAALSGFHIIEGKPSASADLVRALAMRSPKCKYFRLVSADDTQATWETWHRDHDEPTRLVYTIEEARKAGLRGGNWNTREKQMLVKTCSTVLARWVYTIETMGLYCPEEMGDYVDTVGEAA
jgi:anti-sigma factor RsiW